MRLLAGTLVLALLAGPAAAQMSEYEARYGKAVEVALTDILRDPDQYADRAVITRGRLDTGGDQRSFVLRDTFGGAAALSPVSEMAGPFEQMARGWIGRDLEVTGAVLRERQMRATFEEVRVTILIWSFTGPEEDVKEEDARPVTRADLVKWDGDHDGELVRVVGKFRGRNLFGDLPSQSQAGTRDWVIKDELYAVWITGKKPKGKGFELDAGMKRDTDKWLSVVGRPLTRRGVVYVRASIVTVTKPPSASADVAPPPPPPERPKVPPVIVFTLPLDGDADVPVRTTFHIQFSKDMAEETFGGRVLVRYAGQPRPGDPLFDRPILAYDGGRRALSVDPGDAVRAGRVLEIRLLSGILDIEGLALVPRRGEPAGDATEVLHYGLGGP